MNVRKYLAKLEDFSDKEILVTGGTSGIGLSLVKELLDKRARVTVLARNMKKAKEVKDKFALDYPNNPIDIIKYDQSNDQSVINACQEIATKHPHFYAIVLNAGVFQTKKSMTCVDDIYTTIKTNYVGLSLFMKTILPLLEGEHRFIFQGSLICKLHDKRINSLQDKKLSSLQQYCISKSGVEALFYYYSQLNDQNNSFYLVEPGVTSTDIIRDFPSIIRVLGKGFLKVFSHSNERAALTAMKALQTTTEKNSFIVPRGFLTCAGLPVIKKFPKHRQRPYLVDLVSQIQQHCLVFQKN